MAGVYGLAGDRMTGRVAIASVPEGEDVGAALAGGGSALAWP